MDTTPQHQPLLTPTEQLQAAQKQQSESDSIGTDQKPIILSIDAIGGYGLAGVDDPTIDV